MKKPVKKTVKKVDWAAPDLSLEDRVLGLVVKVDNLEYKINVLGNDVNNLKAEMLHKPNQLWGAVKTLEKRVDYACEVVGDVRRDSMADQPSVRSNYQFCVIGDKAKHQYPISRTWHTSQETAERYAASLVRNSSTTEELLVVQVVSKVGRKEPDIKVVRV